jgi:hypothetical protein
LKKRLPSLKKKNYSSWIQSKLKEKESHGDVSIDQEVQKFAEWSKDKLGIKSLPKIVLSYDTDKAQDNPSTGQYTMDQDEIWVYVDNRNPIDVMRTVFHELVHYRQNELGMIKPGDSYPGSPMEAMADMLAGKYIKIYGKENKHLFQ